jgi:hypothetical protein
MSLTSYRAAPSRDTDFKAFPAHAQRAALPALRPLRNRLACTSERRPEGVRQCHRSAKTPKGPPLRDSPVDFVNGLFRTPTSYNAWRRPTLPDLKAQYHRRGLVSRPSSRWDRVGHRRYGHQAMKLVDAGFKSMHTQEFEWFKGRIWLEKFSINQDLQACR